MQDRVWAFSIQPAGLFCLLRASALLPHHPYRNFFILVRVKRPPVIMILLSILAGAGIVQMTVLIGISIYRTVEFHQQINELQARVVLLGQDVRDLQDMRQKSYNPEFLEQLARCQGFVGEKEEILVDQHALQEVNEAACRLPVLRP